MDVHHVVEGPDDAPPLVLSNSLGSRLEMWDPQVPELARDLRVLRYDLRGHGRSPVPPPPFAIADLGSDLLALLDRVDVARAHLCGLSLGGLVSLWVAIHAPERVDRLVLCSTAPRFGTPEPWFERAALVRAEGTAAVADAVVGRWFTPAFATRRPDLVRRMREMIASTPAEGYAACCEVVGAADLRGELGAVRAATLVVAGRADPAVTAEDVDALARGIPDCRLEVVDAAHLSNVERPDEVTKLIRDHVLSREGEP